MLFKEKHVKMIETGDKTQTRRLWRRPQVKIGGRYPIKTYLYATLGDPRHHGFIRVTGMRVERLGAISPADARREGYGSVRQFRAAFAEIHGSFWEDARVFVVDFEYDGRKP